MINNKSEKLRCAILGSGNIGTDLLMKSMRSRFLECVLFVGQNDRSPGLIHAQNLGVKTSSQKIKAIIDDPDCCDLVFDATSASDHRAHWAILERLGKVVIDMTPSRVGTWIVPAIDMRVINQEKNINVVSCGGQAGIPLIHALKDKNSTIEYIELICSIASQSAGAACRRNIDEYIENTRESVRFFSGCPDVKSILILNPALPCMDMQTTIFARIKNPDLERISVAVAEMVKKIQAYVPGYHLVVGPTFEHGRLTMTVRVRGQGDYLPGYAGNLDIINCAAIATAEEYARLNINSRESRREYARSTHH